MARNGKLCSMSTCRMISPTAPVAPTTATLGSTEVSLNGCRVGAAQKGTRSNRHFPSLRKIGKGSFALQTMQGVAKFSGYLVAEVVRLRRSAASPKSHDFGYLQRIWLHPQCKASCRCARKRHCRVSGLLI